MKKVTARKYLLVLSMLFTLLIVLIPGCTPAQKPVPGFHPKLSISEPPVLGKPVKLTLTFDSPVPEGLEETELDYRAQISLLPGCYDVIEGDVEQIGKIIAGKVNSLEITIKSLRTGSADISAYVILLLPSGDTWGDWENDYLYIQIYDDHTDVSEKPLTNITPTEITTTYTTTTSTTETPSSSSPPTTLNTTISPSIPTNGGNNQ